jgi:hypothetical protein
MALDARNTEEEKKRNYRLLVTAEAGGAEPRKPMRSDLDYAVNPRIESLSPSHRPGQTHLNF